MSSIDAYVKNDKNYENIYKQMHKEIKDQLLQTLQNDHGMIDYLIEVY